MLTKSKEVNKMKKKDPIGFPLGWITFGLGIAGWYLMEWTDKIEEWFKCLTRKTTT